MRHAPLSLLAPLVLGPVLLVSACDRSSNSPASPRTSEMVRLSQAPIDAVPLAREVRPEPRPAPEPVAPTEPATAEPETPAAPVATPPAPLPAPAAPPAPSQNPATTNGVVPED